MKCVKQFNGYYGCDWCEEVAQSIRQRRVRIGTKGTKRTDRSFRTKSQPQHHTPNVDCPFLNIPGMDMIDSWPLCFMHQVGGLTKNLILHYRPYHFPGLFVQKVIIELKKSKIYDLSKNAVVVVKPF